MKQSILRGWLLKCYTQQRKDDSQNCDEEILGFIIDMILMTILLYCKRFII